MSIGYSPHDALHFTTHGDIYLIRGLMSDVSETSALQGVALAPICQSNLMLIG
jgi:hypothetical protein